jgi:hypothetical protein
MVLENTKFRDCLLKGVGNYRSLLRAIPLFGRSNLPYSEQAPKPLFIPTYPSAATIGAI